jgi:hypothetical protein
LPVIILMFTSTLYSQSKKEQIEYLSFQVDSIRTIQIKEQQLANSKEAELNDKIIELSNSLKSIQDEITGSKVEIERKKGLIESQSQSLKSMENEFARIKVEIAHRDSLIASQSKFLKDLENNVNYYRDSFSILKKSKNIEFLGSYEMNLDNSQLLSELNLTVDFFNNSSDGGNWENLKCVDELKITEQAKIVFRMDNRKLGIVIYTVWNPESEAWHKIPGTNIIAVFENIEGDWKLIQKYNTYSEPYSFRGTGAAFLGVQVIGKSKLGFVFWGGTHLNGGYIEETYAIFQFDGNGIDRIYDGIRYVSDQASKTEEEISKNPVGYTNDFYELTFQETNQEYYNLIETKKSHGKIVSTRTLKFNPLTQKYE